MNRETPRKYDSKAAAALFAQGRHDALADIYLAGIQAFSRTLIRRFDGAAKPILNRFVGDFLFYFSQPEFRPSAGRLRRFLDLNRAIAVLTATSGWRTTDGAIAAMASPDALLIKILALYNAQCRTKVDLSKFFDADARLASLWYFRYLELYKHGMANDIVARNLRRTAASPDPRLTFADIEARHAFFGVTYIDPSLESALKPVVNKLVGEWPVEGMAPPAADPNGPVVIVTSRWSRIEAVHRCMAAYVSGLKARRPVALAHLGPPRDDLDTDGFSAVVNLRINGVTLDVAALCALRPSVLFFTDIGMNIESIRLANLRIAPIQIAGYGHPSSAHGAQVDAWIGGAEVEDESSAKYYVERMMLLPGAGVIPARPDTPRPDKPKIAKAGEVVRIGCPWSAQKMNSAHIRRLRAIADKAGKPVVYHFFPAVGALGNAIAMISRDLATILEEKQIEVEPPVAYPGYSARLMEMDLMLDSHPFGGFATAIDAVHLGKPMATLRGDRFAGRSAGFVLERAGVGELVCADEDTFIDTAVSLITDDARRRRLSQALLKADLDAALHSDQSSDAFADAIDGLTSGRWKLGPGKPIVVAPAPTEMDAPQAKKKTKPKSGKKPAAKKPTTKKASAAKKPSAGRKPSTAKKKRA